MNRIVVKDLPRFVKECELREIFEKHGKITDLYMVTTPDGIFRRICFIGYASHEEAVQAINYRNNSMIHNHKIKIEMCEEKKLSSNPESYDTGNVDRKAFYSKEFWIQNLQNIDENILKKELVKYGKITDFKIKEKGIYIKFLNGDDALNFMRNTKVICGRRVRITIYKEDGVESLKDHFNTLFFNFQMVYKNVSEIENIAKECLIDITNKNLGVQMALLESSLVAQTQKFLMKNGIDLHQKTELDKKVLIVRCSDIVGALGLIKYNKRSSIAPSRCLAIVEFETEKEAESTQKQINLRQLHNNIIYAEYCVKKIKCMENVNIDSVSDHSNLQTQNSNKYPLLQKKLCIKNLPFQASKDELKLLFAGFGNIVDVRIPKNNMGRSRGFGFITFEDPKTIDKIIEQCSNMHLYGRRLVLEKAQK